MRRLVWCLALISLIAACGSSGRVSTPGSTGTTRSGDTSTSLRTQPPGVLRGVPVRSFECSQPAVSSDVDPLPIEGAQVFLLCPLGTPGRPSEPVTVGANDPVFEVLMGALSVADEPATSGAVCPAYADLSQVVLAQTTGRVYRVSIPVDGCMHYQHDALNALSHARGA